jgi:hypothetical protein
LKKNLPFFIKLKRVLINRYRGEQKAFNKKEVEDALARLGYKPVSVNKKLIDFKQNHQYQK